MSSVTLASAPEDVTALEAAEAHHARLAGELAGRVSMLLTAADRDPGAAARIHAGLVTFCERSLLPHAAAEEAVLYPAAHALPEARLLIESLIGEHRALKGLVATLRDAPRSESVPADARALQVLFEEHVAKENGLVLPLLAMAPEVSLAGLLDGMHHQHADVAGAAQGEPEERGGCGGTCGCGGSDDTAEPELDVREVPHSLRHATVFGALAAVPAGSAMVLVAPHDPLPLLAQIEQRNPGVFAVDYLERGPETWRLRLAHR